VFILKGVKVVCFDTVLQVLILKELEQGKRRTKESEEKAAGSEDSALRFCILRTATGVTVLRRTFTQVLWYTRGNRLSRKKKLGHCWSWRKIGRQRFWLEKSVCHAAAVC
jgi:hypothetical protein